MIPAAHDGGSPPLMEYERDPAAIYEASFRIIEAEADLARVPEEARPLAIRLIHACGMTDITADLAVSAGAVERGIAALRAGAAIFCDAEMVAHGIIRRHLPAGNDVICRLNDAGVAERATALRTTRSAAQVELWGDDLAGAVIAIGNAPTALFHLLERLRDGAPRPALILGFPVGFVGAAESKAALAGHSFGVPFVTLFGRRGGSALAAAAVNALSLMAKGAGA
ncbi:precorrin-8X methylmutase [Consotaella salsifontis]|uniref:Precorrin-8X methylmutase n=1 Tax=Consotaella salsifontis TaxID=1365950 RepID=A0A1T4SK18_9HYPH|nr:precorrin-8X methylmutase [Consotaella salsifontis]SKA28201.1 precorrin-8X methylmutase [Consotaella salsifontis]